MHTTSTWTRWSGAGLIALTIGCGDDGAGPTTDATTGGSDTTAEPTTTPTTTTDATTSTDPTTGTTDGSSDGTSTDPSTDAITGSTTTASVCGDGAVDADETCDDGNLDDGDGCSAGCALEPVVCGDGWVGAGETCDDGNRVDTDGCTNTCTSAACGDGVVQDMVEGCDDGNAVDGDGCSAVCALESCGDGVVQAPEQCDDGDDDDTDECRTTCLTALCGDGVVHEGVEQCDDGDMDDDDACLTTCVAAACGDGVVQAGVEGCDDGDVVSGDGCSAACLLQFKPNLLQCGASDRDVGEFIPPLVDLTLVASCTPDADTQAIVFSRQAMGLFDAAQIKAYVEGGGRVLTEIFISDEVYNAVFAAGAVEVGFIGACSDVAPTVVQFSPEDPFWGANGFTQIPVGESGCGNDSASYAGLVPLAGWSETEVSIGYRDAGAGRVWVTNFDWQDTDAAGEVFDYTRKLMGYMITHP